MSDDVKILARAWLGTADDTVGHGKMVRDLLARVEILEADRLETPGGYKMAMNPDSLGEYVGRLERERDEARAEVERLRLEKIGDASTIEMYAAEAKRLDEECERLRAEAAPDWCHCKCHKDGAPWCNPCCPDRPSAERRVEETERYYGDLVEEVSSVLDHDLSESLVDAAKRVTRERDEAREALSFERKQALMDLEERDTLRSRLAIAREALEGVERMTRHAWPDVAEYARRALKAMGGQGEAE